MNANNTILVVGSLHYDVFVDAPHRPVAGETVAGTKWVPKFGGKGGNQAVAAARAGANVRMVSAVGQDAFGDFLLDHLSKNGVEHDLIARLADIASGMSVAISDSTGDYGAVIVSGSNLAIDPDRLQADTIWDGVSHLILQNEADEALNITAAKLAKKHGVTVVLNAAPARILPSELMDNIDILVVNAIEAASLCGVQVHDQDTATAAVRELAVAFPMVVVTIGGDGVVWAKGETIHTEPGQDVSVISTHGAGDCFVGNLVACLANQYPEPEAISRANAAAAKHVSTTV